MYKVRRCPICKEYIHIHNKQDRYKYTLKNRCEHVPEEEMTKSELDSFFNQRIK